MSNKLDKYIASYFFNAEEIIRQKNPENIITLQFFQRKDDVLLAGMQEVLDLLEKHTDTSKYSIRYLKDGTKINNLDIVLELEGHYQDFGKYEGMIDGILARSTSLATNAYRCVKEAKGKEIIFMGDRADHYLMQEIDGKAMRIAGINIMSTLAQQSKNETKKPFGSVPHILIQNFDGDTAAAMQAYQDVFPEFKYISLVDYKNNVIEQALESYKILGSKLSGVRIDTSKNMKDHMFDNEIDKEEYYGVNVEQVKRLRKALDQAGAKDVKIIVSSGFDYKKIKHFEENNAPVDFYGVGQSIFKLTSSFSADATLLNNKKQAKEGREYRNNPNLIIYKRQGANK
ncbi:nicotinate phosphoribosyltransferase [Mycoplasmopsis lipofaciens]|uniref:nicotinate phosphoribosyltransferase n=1 Tax=Mycoplasmopsis lipofaciens TaxID=114884 RepID=UPI0004830D12|nr:nicotinate phosphoribosyltransferase [Mycoplasmopsis lipofaciens]